MFKNVTVTANKAGEVVVPSNDNPTFGYIRVVQTRTMVDNRNWLRKKDVSSLIQGEVQDLNDLCLMEGDTLPGNIIIRESLEPFNTNNPEKDYKYAGETGVVCCLDGQPIYRRAIYDASGKLQDELIQHNNTEAIKAANEALKNAEAII
jgi:hypothetical protein